MNALALEFPQVLWTVIWAIVTEKLFFINFTHVGCKIPSEQHKMQQTGSAFDFLTCYSNDGNTFLSQIVSGNEMWVAYDSPETKWQSMEWGHTSSPSPQKLNPSKSWHFKKSCGQFIGIEKAFYWLIFSDKVKQSIKMFIVKCLRNCIMQYRISTEEGSQKA